MSDLVEVGNRLKISAEKTKSCTAINQRGRANSFERKDLRVQGDSLFQLALPKRFCCPSEIQLPVLTKNGQAGCLQA